MPVRETLFLDVSPALAQIGVLDSAFKKATTNLGNGLSNAGKQLSLQKVGTELTTVGKSLTRNITVPVAAAGAASIFMASQFEASMAKIVGLSGLSQKSVEGLKTEVLDLAGETATAPKELADALYFITSSGFTGAEAMRVLQTSAKASAAGLGETEEVAKALTATLASYGKENITASHAADVLTAAVKFGRAEADEFAAGMGSVVPIASQLGVSFEDVSATLAAMTLVGVETDTAFTNVSAVMSGLLKVTPASAEALAKVGLSGAELRETIKQPGGLLTVMRQLDQAFGGNVDAMAEVFPNIRALRGVMALLAQNGDEVDKVFRGVTNSTGTMDRAFNVARKTSAFQFKQGLADLQVAAIELGNALLPIAGRIVGAVSDIAGAFTGLPESTQSFLLIAAAATAALGPLLRLSGAAISFGQAFSEGGIKGGLARAGTSLGILAAGIAVIKPQLDELGVSAELSGAAIGALTGAPFGPWGAGIGLVLGGVAGAFGLLGESTSEAAREAEEAMARIDAAVQSTATKLAESGGIFSGQLVQDVAKQVGLYGELGNVLGEVGVTWDQMANLINTKGPSAVQTTGSLREAFGLTVPEANALLAVTSKWGLALDEATQKSVNQGIALGNLGAVQQVAEQAFNRSSATLARLAGTQAGLNLSLHDAGNILTPVIGKAREHANAVLAQSGSADAAAFTMSLYRQRMIDSLTPVTQSTEKATALVDELLKIQSPEPIEIKATDLTAPPFEAAVKRGLHWEAQTPTADVNADDNTDRAFGPAKGKADTWRVNNPRTGIHADDNTGGPFGAAFNRGGSWGGFNPHTGIFADDFASPVIAAVQAQRIADKSFTIFAYTTSVGTPLTGGGHAKGGIVGAADGGVRSRMVLVGELGPELVFLPNGSRVITAAASRGALSAMKSGGSSSGGSTQIGPIMVEVNGVTDPGVGRAVGDQIAEGVATGLRRRNLVLAVRGG